MEKTTYAERLLLDLFGAQLLALLAQPNIDKTKFISDMLSSMERVGHRKNLGELQGVLTRLKIDHPSPSA